MCYLQGNLPDGGKKRKTMPKGKKQKNCMIRKKIYRKEEEGKNKVEGEKKRSKIKEEKELFTAPITPEAYTRSPEDIIINP